MAATVLNTARAVEMSVFIVRAFVRIREVLAGHKALANKIRQLENRLTEHDAQITSIIEAIKQLMSPTAVPKKRRIGF